MKKIKKINWSKLTKSQKRRLVLSATALGTLSTLAVSLTKCSKTDLPNNILSTETGKLYLVDVLENKKNVSLKNSNGEMIKYNFDESTVAIVGAKAGKTKKGKDYPVALVDSLGNLTLGYMDGKYLENGFLDSITVLNNDFTTYYVESVGGALLRNDIEIENNSKIFTLFDLNAQILGSVSSTVSEEGYSWNETLAVNNNKFIYGFISNEVLSEFEVIDDDMQKKRIDENAGELVVGDMYVVNIHTALNVRSEANTIGSPIDKLQYATEIAVIRNVEPVYDENIKWVYIKYISSETQEEKRGWVAAQICSTNENYIVAKDEFVYVERPKTREEELEDNPLVTNENDINAQNAIVLNPNTGQILFAKDAFNSKEIASITKILTAYIICKYGNIDDTITYSKRAISVDGHKDEGYSTNTPEVAYEGNKISIKDALHISLLKSDNSTTVALQEYIENLTGRNFADIMNEEAKLIGCKDSNFTNSFGYEDKDHVASACDMAKILAHIYKNMPSVIEIMGTEYYFVQNVPLKNDSNTLLLNDEYAIGGKTGWTSTAGQTMVSIFEKDGKAIVVATLNGSTTESKFQDAHLLARYGFAYLKYQKENTIGLSNILFENGVSTLKTDLEEENHKTK